MQPSTEQAELSDQQVRSELQRIVSSEACRRSPQLLRLLTFLVDESLSGRAERLKEYVIGVEVFARPPSYDPRIDSLVRVEAKRLRTLLNEYYSDEGGHNPVRITLRAGTYRPLFCLNRVIETPIAESGQRRIWRWLALGIGCLALVGAVAAFVMRSQFSLSMPIHTVAVLPFDNLANDPAGSLFCFGLTDEITSELAKLGHLRVVSRTSAEAFKRGDDISTLAQRLKADVVLEGSVSKSENEIRIIAQLINAKDGIHIWSESYVRPSSNALRVQDEVSQLIAAALRKRLAPNTPQPDKKSRYSQNTEANQLYWEGSFLRTPMGKTGWRKDLAQSATYFEDAVKKDDRFAAAYAALADVYVSLAWERGGGPVTQDFMTRSRRAAERALSLDDTLAEAYGALGTVQFFYDYDPVASERSFQRALSLDPSNGKVRMWYAYALTMQRRAEEAISQARQARDLDPLSFVATTHLAVVYYFSRHNDEALKVVNGTLGFANTAPAHGLRGMILESQGDYGNAIREYQAGLQIVPNHPYIKGMLGHAYAMSGRPSEAEQFLNDGGLTYEQGGLSDLKLAYIYLALGRREAALNHLEHDYDLRDPELPYVNADPVFDPLRDETRFRTLIARMRLSE